MQSMRICSDGNYLPRPGTSFSLEGERRIHRCGVASRFLSLTRSSYRDPRPRPRLLLVCRRLA
jgi:hypothetical protein